MAKDFKFENPIYKINKDANVVECKIPVTMRKNSNIGYLSMISYYCGGIRLNKEITAAYCRVRDGGIGRARQLVGDNKDIEFAKKLAYKKAKRNLWKKLMTFYDLLQKQFFRIKVEFYNSYFKYKSQVENENRSIENLVKNNKENLEAMPEPQNGWIGRTNLGEWFIVIRKENTDFYTMIYQDGGYSKGALSNSIEDADFDIYGKSKEDQIDVLVNSNDFLQAASDNTCDKNIIWRRNWRDEEE